MKKNTISKISKFLFSIFTLGIILNPISASAKVKEPDLDDMAKKEISSYLSDNRSDVISDLNEVSNSNVISVEEYTDSSGNNIKVETRAITNEEGILIKNIREYITPSTSENNPLIRANAPTKTVRDKYGLFKYGVQGGNGYLVAEYKYTSVYNPGRTVSQFFGATGYISGTSDYKLIRVDPNWDTAASTNVSASVVLYMDKGALYPTISYKNTCRFDYQGAVYFSWF